MKENKPKEIRYIAYLRRSSEDGEDKQVQSIETQERELTEFAARHGLIIVGTIKESKSAFKLGREGFEKLLATFSSKEANGLLVWHPNRIARNPIDGARIIDCIDRGEILEVRTPTARYGNTSTEKMMLAFEFIFSKKDSDDKSGFVKDGLTTRAASGGWPNGVAKIGYTNDKTQEKGNRSWMVDPIRFPLIRMIFQMFLSGKYSVSELHRIARDKLKLSTPQRKKSGGKPIALSYIYHMLADPIYAGFFVYNDKRYPLNKSLEHVITEDEYWKIQTMLAQKGRPRGRSENRKGLYNYLMRDKNGGAVMADFKHQLICDCRKKFAYAHKTQCPQCGILIDNIIKPNYLSYVFYRSIKEAKERKITKKKVRGMEEKKIDQKIVDYFYSEVAISEELSQWCVDNISELKDKELDGARAVVVSQDEAEANIKRKLSRLLDLRLNRDDLSVEEETQLNEKETALRAELTQVRKLKDNANVSTQQLDKMNRKFSLMAEIMNTLQNGSREARKDILMEFGSNLTLDDGKVSICNVKEVQIFLDCLKVARSENHEFEPRNCVDTTGQNKVFDSVIPTLLLG